MRSRLAFLAAVAAALIACSSKDEHPAAVDPNPPTDSAFDSTVDAEEDTEVPVDSAIATTDAKSDATTDGDAGGSSDAKDAAGDGVASDATSSDAFTLIDAPFDVPADADAAMFVNCYDTVKNPDETDIDCGGVCRAVRKCEVGKSCLVDADCVQGKCGSTTKQCSEPACNDIVWNGAETDVDCGGPSCGKCANDKRCKFATDCLSNVCGPGGVCSAPQCTDGVKNGTESDIDCGGTCPKKCLIGAACAGPADCATGACIASTCRCPSGMTQLNVPTGSGTYCIDQVEVTNSDYAAFLTSGFADPTTQDPVLCKDWNTSFVPTSSWPAPSGREGHPVRGVDWCDAVSYCKAKGKVLCGKIGGGSTPVATFADEKVSKWTNACSQGVNPYPYGSTYSATSCNGADLWATVDGGVPNTWGVLNGTIFLNTTCLGGPASNVYQLSGNVAEWEDSCESTTGGDAGVDGGDGGLSGATDNCLVRGGSFLSNAADLQCGAKRLVPRNTRAADIGFRCCL